MTELTIIAIFGGISMFGIAIGFIYAAKTSVESSHIK